MNKPNFKFVIVGHVDHGKSTLIGRLLYDTGSLSPDKLEEIERTSKELGRKTEFAYLLDHLEEERQQGITIDTTQVFFKTDKREYVIIDAPGHVEFVKNMITGASQAEAALLIIDANEGMQEQTKRHAMIISLLGIDQVIVVMNKMDLVNFSEKVYQSQKDRVERFLKTLNIRAFEYIPISALNGDNIAKRSGNIQWHKGPTILEALDIFESKVPSDNQPLIFPIQDIYKVDDKRVAVGKVETGRLLEGEEVEILPDIRTTKIKSIEKFHEQPKFSSAGECVGITTEDSIFLERGNVLCEPGREPKITDNFEANIFWMAKEGYLVGQRLTLRCATQEISCRIEKIHKRINSSTLEVIEENSQRIESLEVGVAIIRTKKPIVVQTFKDLKEIGRFVLVKDDSIVSGGIVTKVEG